MTRIVSAPGPDYLQESRAQEVQDWSHESPSPRTSSPTSLVPQTSQTTSQASLTV
jgi:hypothetical protein